MDRALGGPGGGGGMASQSNCTGRKALRGREGRHTRSFGGPACCRSLHIEGAMVSKDKCALFLGYEVCFLNSLRYTRFL